MPVDNMPPTYGLILAGGQARRMGGGDKALLRIGERSILDRVIDRLAPHCIGLVLNANGEPARFSSYRLPVVADDIAGFAGPLAGILAGLDFVAREAPSVEWMVSAPGDCPFLPRDLVPRLHAARLASGQPLACAGSNGRTHPVVGLWQVGLRADLRRALVDEDLRKIDRWTARHGVALSEWSGAPVDPFFNVNTPEDLAEAAKIEASAAA